MRNLPGSELQRSCLRIEAGERSKHTNVVTKRSSSKSIFMNMMAHFPSADVQLCICLLCLCLFFFFLIYFYFFKTLKDISTCALRDGKKRCTCTLYCWLHRKGFLCLRDLWGRRKECIHLQPYELMKGGLQKVNLMDNWISNLSLSDS